MQASEEERSAIYADGVAYGEHLAEATMRQMLSALETVVQAIDRWDFPDSGIYLDVSEVADVRDAVRAGRAMLGAHLTDSSSTNTSPSS